jgi:hypothetical protein
MEHDRFGAQRLAQPVSNIELRLPGLKPDSASIKAIKTAALGLTCLRGLTHVNCWNASSPSIGSFSLSHGDSQLPPDVGIGRSHVCPREADHRTKIILRRFLST